MLTRLLRPEAAGDPAPACAVVSWAGASDAEGSAITCYSSYDLASRSCLIVLGAEPSYAEGSTVVHYPSDDLASRLCTALP